jgi:GST-like protein
VKSEAAAAGFRAEVDAYAKRLWTVMEGAARTPWFLGDSFSALDIYLAVMTRWRPGKIWFAENAPLLAAAAQKASALPVIEPVMLRNFPPKPATG